MKFGYTILYVENVADTVSFYENAFGFVKRFVTEDNTYGELDTGTTTLSFASFDMAKNNGFTLDINKNLAAPFEIAFVTDNLDGDFERALKAGAKLVKEPMAKPWGQKVGYLKDLNGFLIEICSPIN